MNYDIFREELATRYPTFGHALWEPSPGEHYTAVEIGDVGFIREGRFHRLFNVLLSGDDPSHQCGVPQLHEPLVLRTSPPIDTSTLWPNDLRSNGVLDRIEDRRREAREPDEAAQVSFSCSRRRGAILSLPTPALRKDTTARGDFAKYIIKHIDKWIAFARGRGLGISREDIILVTGCHLTRTWATVAFQREGEQVSFGVQVSGVSDVMWQFTREGAHGVAYNLGPSGQNLPENQCIFIRGFRVARFSIILPRLRGAAGPAQLPDEDDPDPDTQLDPGETGYQDPLRTILEYIAMAAPDCDMALVHDDDLQNIDTASLESLQPDTMTSHLWRSAPKMWQLSCDISPTGHSDKGKSKSKVPSQITVAALFKFDTAHELEPVISRNMTQEPKGDKSTDHKKTQFMSRIRNQSLKSMNQSLKSMSESLKSMNILDDLDDWSTRQLEEHGGQQVSEAHNLLETYGAKLSPEDLNRAEYLLSYTVDLGILLKRRHLLARRETAKRYDRRAGEVLRMIKAMLDP